MEINLNNRKVYSRSSFIGIILKTFALCSFLGKTIHCRDNPNNLAGISTSDYQNINAIGEIFLEKNPIKNFNIGMSLDNYLYGHPQPLPNPHRSNIHELINVGSSYVVSLALDFSLTPLSSLAPKERKQRLLSWRDSKSETKRSIYNLLCSLCFLLLASEPEFLRYTGYLNGK